MGSQTVNTNVPGQEPELHLLITDGQYNEPLYKHLFREIDEFFFPKKLPPLKLESKPEPVKDLWGFYDYKRNGVLGSTGVHVLHYRDGRPQLCGLQACRDRCPHSRK